MDSKQHWEDVYRSKASDAVSWYRPHLDISLTLICEAASDRNAAIIRNIGTSPPGQFRAPAQDNFGTADSDQKLQHASVTFGVDDDATCSQCRDVHRQSPVENQFLRRTLYEKTQNLTNSKNYAILHENLCDMRDWPQRPAGRLEKPLRNFLYL